MSRYVKLGTNEVKPLISSPISKYNSSRSFSARKGNPSPNNKKTMEVIKHTLPSKVVVHDSSFTKDHPALHLSQPDHVMSKSASASDYFVNTKKDGKNDYIVHSGNGIQSKIGLRIRENMARYEPNQNKYQSKEGVSYNSAFSDSRVTGESQVRKENKMLEVEEFTAFKNWLTGQMNEYRLRLEKNEQKIVSLDQKLRGDEKNEGFTPKQTEELNKILTLVEKSGNREEHRRNTKMIEELRQNILELHGRIGELSSKKESFSLSIIPKECNHEKQIEAIKAELDRAIKKSQEENSIRKKIEQIDGMLKPLRESFFFRQNLIGKSVSRNKFEDDPIVIRHEERIAVEKAHTAEKINNQNRQSEEKEKSAVVAEQIYYIDSQGYLLDGSKYYLLNEKEERIKLSESEMDILKKHGLI